MSRLKARLGMSEFEKEKLEAESRVRAVLDRASFWHLSQLRSTRWRARLHRLGPRSPAFAKTDPEVPVVNPSLTPC